jgi:hypothetical protein
MLETNNIWGTFKMDLYPTVFFSPAGFCHDLFPR